MLSQQKNTPNYNQNDGVAGCVYILRNDAFKEDFFKIGCTRYTGEKRAEDLNKEASTGTPGMFYCVYEAHAQDCGKAEKEAHRLLDPYRKGKWGQEYFEVDYQTAKEAIDKAVGLVARCTALVPVGKARRVKQKNKHKEICEEDVYEPLHKDSGITLTDVGIGAAIGLLTGIWFL